MKHRRDNGQKIGRIRVTVDMLPKGVQRAHGSKQIEVMKRMFKRACQNYGLFHEMKEREFFISSGEKRRRAEKQKRANARGEGREQQREEREPKYFEDYNG
jgi:ribosomal protein S21